MEIRPRNRREPIGGQPDVDFPPIQNGIDYLLSVTNHLTHGDPPEPRDLKYAILHLQAAVEVLLKARLQREHWSQVFKNPGAATRARGSGCIPPGPFAETAGERRPRNYLAFRGPAAAPCCYKHHIGHRLTKCHTEIYRRAAPCGVLEEGKLFLISWYACGLLLLRRAISAFSSGKAG